MLEELNLYKLMKGENHTKYNEQKTPKKQWNKNRDFGMRKEVEKAYCQRRTYQSTMIR